MINTPEIQQGMMQIYTPDKVRICKEQLSVRRRQLSVCEEQLAIIHAQVSLLRGAVVSADMDDVVMAAAAEWQGLKEDVLKLNGKSAKLHKEIAQLTESLSRWERLMEWSHG